MESNRALRKLRGMLRLQQDALRQGRQAEAERCAEMIQDWLTRHKLAMSDVEAGELDTTIGRTILQDKKGRKRRVLWQTILLSEIAKANDCSAISIDKSNNYHLVGMESDRQIVVTLFRYFSDLARHLSQAETLRHKARRRPGFSDSGFRTGYLIGFAEAV